MQLTQKIQIYPTAEQEKVLWRLSDQCRRLYNLGLAERIEAYRKGEKINYRVQQNELVLTKQVYPELSMVYSKVLQMMLNHLDSDYRSFFALRRNGDLTAQPPGFKSRKYFTTMVYNQSGFRVERGCVKLSHKHPSKEPLCFAIPESFAFGKVFQVTVFQDEKGRFYVSVVYEKKAPEYVDNGLYQAFDLGVAKHTGVNVQGKFVEFRNSRHDRYWNPRLDRLQSRRDHCRKKSRRWHYLDKTFKNHKRKCNRQTKDFQHKLSRKIVDNTKANTIIVGDLNVKGMAQSKRAFSVLNRSVQNNGFLGTFTRFLTYKAELAGKRVIEIDESYTSKKCYVCGKLHDMPLWMRTMRCDCGNVIDRDRNSSVGIMVRFLSQYVLWTGYQQFVGNLRKTGLLTPKLEVYSQEAPLTRVGIVHAGVAWHE
jgi:putative transposase